MRYLFRWWRTCQPPDATAESAHTDFVTLRDTILRALRYDVPDIGPYTNLDRRPHWLRREWAERLSACTGHTITADDIARERTICGLANWLHRTTLSESTLAALRQKGF